MSTVSTTKIKLVLGIGNPDKKYENTYHSAGILLIDYLIKKNPAKVKSQKEKSKSFAFVKFENVIFAKSLVYMNESGKAVAETVKYSKLKPEQIMIAHDDVDINLGDYKISFGRNAAGHKGIESIIKSLGTKNFWRIRIGVGKEKLAKNGIVKKIKAENYVLKKISNTDRKLIESAFEKIIAEGIILDPVVKTR